MTLCHSRCCQRCLFLAHLNLRRRCWAISCCPLIPSALSRLVSQAERLFTTLQEEYATPDTPDDSTQAAEETTESPVETTEPIQYNSPEMELLTLDEETEGNELAQQIQAIIDNYSNIEEVKINERIANFLDEQLQQIRENHDRQQAINRIVDALKQAVRNNIKE